MSEMKNCMNCMRLVPIFDGGARVGQRCQRNPEMRVNRRMHCDEWRSNDIIGAVSVSEVMHEKHT